MKKIWKDIVGFVKKILHKNFELVKANSKIVVDITNALKKLVESPVSDFVVNLIPGDVDNQLLYKLRVIVPQVAKKLAIAHGIVETSQNNNELFGAIIKYLQEKHKDGRRGFWIEFSAELNIALADGEIDFAEAVLMAQMVYREMYGNKLSAAA